MGRIIIFTGKGGVGKTSIAATHALKAARSGKKTLIMSTDMAHNLSDIFEVQVEKEPIKVTENLFAVELDPNYEMGRHYNSIQKALNQMFYQGESEELEADEVLTIPGIEELFSLIKLKEFYESGDYEVIIVDCAPTGETLSLLKFPELMSWYMERIFPIEKVALKVLRPISKAALKLELPDSKAMNDIEKLYLNLAQLQQLLKNRDVCSIRLVTIPEKMVVEETKRSYMYLNLYNFNVDGLIINRVIPKEVNEAFFETWVLLQQQYIQQLNECFGHIPTYLVKWYETDLNGIEALERVLQEDLKQKELLEVLKTTESETFIKSDTGYRLELKLPFTDKSQFELFELPTELTVKIGNFKRNIPLPLVLRNYQVTGAKFNEGTLKIEFEKG